MIAERARLKRASSSASLFQFFSLSLSPVRLSFERKKHFSLKMSNVVKQL
jgi:hypothetical protein